MQVLIVIIEKDGENYIARSPNLLGVSVTGKTRDEVEIAILDRMNRRMVELRGRHQSYKPVSRNPIEETIECVYKYPDRRGETCYAPAKKDGLCGRHWRKLYGHICVNEIGYCPLCHESDSKVLSKFDAPCLFKSENPNWEKKYEKMKLKNRDKWRQERRAVKIKQIEGKFRCTRSTNGNQCVREAYSGGLCLVHL